VLAFISSIVYISNIEYFVKLKSCLRILFLSQGTNAVWGFNFLRVGVLKPFKLLKCILAGGKKSSSFAIFSIANVLDFVRGLATNFASLVLYCPVVVAKEPKGVATLRTLVTTLRMLVTTLPEQETSFTSIVTTLPELTA